jgi:hypothetical protein
MSSLLVLYALIFPFKCHRLPYRRKVALFL